MQNEQEIINYMVSSMLKDPSLYKDERRLALMAHLQFCPDDPLFNILNILNNLLELAQKVTARNKRRFGHRINCLTLGCFNDGKITTIGNWESNDWCKYIKAECPECLCKYWMIKRDEKYELKDRIKNSFDHRESNRSK